MLPHGLRCWVPQQCSQRDVDSAECVLCDIDIGIVRNGSKQIRDFRFWPAFNVADSAICIGIALLFLDMRKKPESDEVTAAETAS